MFIIENMEAICHPQLAQVLAGVEEWADEHIVVPVIEEFYRPPRAWHVRSLLNEFPFRAVVLEVGLLNDALIEWINARYVYSPREPNTRVAYPLRGTSASSHTLTPLEEL